jgi:hypothetical protein
MNEKSLDKAVVTLICEIDSLLIRNERSPEVNEYRRGYQEALTGLKNYGPMLDVVDALRDAGWQAPSRSWRSPSPDTEPHPAAPGADGGEQDR